VCNGNNECLLGSQSAERNAAYRKSQAERFAGVDAALLQRHNDDDATHHTANTDNANNANNANNSNNIPSTQQNNERKRATIGKPPKVCDSADLSGPCYDAVDCSGRLKREGGKLEYDLCGVCGGNNECVGCDGRPFGKKYDACGKCGGNNSTCCVNYCDVADQYWDFMLLPVTLDNLIEKLELTYATVAWLNTNLPTADNVDAAVANKLQVGRMAEFNRIFMQDCLDAFCAESTALYQKLVEANNPVPVFELKHYFQLGSI